MLAAHEVLNRVPALRQTWPVRQARAWREARALREHPRRMAAWFRDTPDMRTRIFVSNLELPEAPDVCRPGHVVVSLFDGDGELVASLRTALARNASLVLEAHDLLPASVRGQLPSGRVQVDFEAAQLGSSRAYFHWYNERGLTASHEKFGMTIPAVAGYWTVPSVRHGPTYRVHLAIVNLDTTPYESSVSLKSASGEEAITRVQIAPGGSRFLTLDEMFDDPAALLGDAPGILYFGNNRQPAMYYYFVANDALGTWRVQHL